LDWGVWKLAGIKELRARAGTCRLECVDYRVRRINQRARNKTQWQMNDGSRNVQKPNWDRVSG
jgi:hypothetical protein